jgi:hypothetical protein
MHGSHGLVSEIHSRRRGRAVALPGHCTTPGRRRCESLCGIQLAEGAALVEASTLSAGVLDFDLGNDDSSAEFLSFFILAESTARSNNGHRHPSSSSQAAKISLTQLRPCFVSGERRAPLPLLRGRGRRRVPQRITPTFKSKKKQDAEKQAAERPGNTPATTPLPKNRRRAAITTTFCRRPIG